MHAQLHELAVFILRLCFKKLKQFTFNFYPSTFLA